MTKNSKVLSLKYRPQTFEDLIGQEVTAKTIYNSITQYNSDNITILNENYLNHK